MKKEYLKPEADITEWDDKDVFLQASSDIDENDDIYWTPYY